MPLPAKVGGFIVNPLSCNPTDRGPRFGIRAHDIGRSSADEIARRVSAVGMDCVQLAVAKTIDGIAFGPGMLGGGAALSIGHAFRRHHVKVEVLGCYVNPIHPDPLARAAGIECFKEHLRHAREFGCNIVALESGSVDPDYQPHPDNRSDAAWQDLSEVLADLAAEAGRHGVVVGIEPVFGHVLDNCERTRALLDVIDSPHLRVVLDPVNLISPETAADSRGVTLRALESLGDRIVVLHLKDFRIAADGLQHVAFGEGAYDPSNLLDWAMRHHPGMAIILEETRPERLPAMLRELLQLTRPSLS